MFGIRESVHVGDRRREEEGSVWRDAWQCVKESRIVVRRDHLRNLCIQPRDYRVHQLELVQSDVYLAQLQTPQLLPSIDTERFLDTLIETPSLQEPTYRGLQLAPPQPVLHPVIDQE